MSTHDEPVDIVCGLTKFYRYITAFYEKYGLQKYVKLAHAVNGCYWNESSCTWMVTTVNTKTGETHRKECDVLVNATGVLNAWKWPDVPGVSSFTGEMAHSAAWDTSIDLTDKTVALVGNGYVVTIDSCTSSRSVKLTLHNRSSGIQILPAILPKVKKVVHIFRSPAWVVTPFGNSAPRPFTDQEKENFATNPEAHLTLRKHIEATNNGFFKMFLKNTPECKMARKQFSDQMREVLKDDELSSKIVPSWPLGCRRLTPGVGYLKALQHPKTELVQEALTQVTPTGVITASGREFDVDVIICASGFDTSFRPKYPIIGPGGQDLRALWADEPKGYLGVAVPEFPNYFTFLGPNCPIGNGPVLSAIEAQGDYICHFLNRIQTENIR